MEGNKSISEEEGKQSLEQFKATDAQLEEYQKKFSKASEDNKIMLQEVENKMFELKTIIEKLEAGKRDIENVEEQIQMLASEVKKDEEKNTSSSNQ